VAFDSFGNGEMPCAGVLGGVFELSAVPIGFAPDFAPFAAAFGVPSGAAGGLCTTPFGAGAGLVMGGLGATLVTANAAVERDVSARKASAAETVFVMSWLSEFY
jgi:hypothetical protein